MLVHDATYPSHVNTAGLPHPESVFPAQILA